MWRRNKISFQSGAPCVCHLGPRLARLGWAFFIVAAMWLTSVARAEPPTVRLVSPRPAEMLAPDATLVVQADALASAGRRIVRVDFFIRGRNRRIGTATAEPFALTVDVRTLAVRELMSVTACATDDLGQTADSEPVWFTLREDAPSPPRVAVREERHISRHVAGSGHEGIPALAELENGDLLCVFYAGRYELSLDCSIYLTRLPRGAREWEPPRMIVPGAGVSRVNPVLLVHRDGSITCFYANVEGGRNFEYCRPCYRVSRDGGVTWGFEQRMPEPRFDHPTGTIFAVKPIHLADGAVLLPANRESETRDPLRGWTSLFYRSADDGRTWTESAELLSTPGNIQPTAQQLADGSLVAFFRPRGRDAKLWRSTSSDGGVTWAPLEKTPLDNPSTRSDFVVLAGGELVLACNPSPRTRSPVSLFMSHDAGKTWPVRRDIETGPGYYGYPAVLRTRDGRIHVAYDLNRYSIKHVVVDRAWFDEPPRPLAYQPPLP